MARPRWTPPLSAALFSSQFLAFIATAAAAAVSPENHYSGISKLTLFFSLFTAACIYMTNRRGQYYACTQTKVPLCNACATAVYGAGSYGTLQTLCFMFAALWGDIMLVRASLFSAYILLVTNMMVRAQMCVGIPVLLSPITSSLTT